MNILVCIKPVPDPEKYSSLEIDPQTGTLIRDGISAIINPSDRNALEEALKISDSYGGTVTVLSMAPASARDKIMESLAMGADRAFLVSDRVFGGSDTYATSYVLARAAKWAESKSLKDADIYDLILMGNESTDGATAHVPSQLAEWLSLPCICNVNKIELSADYEKECPKRSCHRSYPVSIKVWKKTETCREIYEGTLPALISVSRDINKPRLINAIGVIKASKKPLTIVTNEDLCIEKEKTGLKGSPTQMGELTMPDIDRSALDMGRDADEVADKILRIIRKAGV